MTPLKKILVVDDDPRQRELLLRYLREQQLEVALAANGKEMDEVLQRESISLIVLDLMLPAEDGLSIIRRLRASGNTIPILMLTAKGDDVDRIVGLEVGADDYLAKPFNPRELLARIHAVLRRNATPSQAQTPPGNPPSTAVRFGPFLFDPVARALTKNGQPVSLTSGEFSVLKVLVQHAGEPLSREQLMTLAHGRPYGAYDRSLDVRISRLRKLIERSPHNPKHLQTVWGVGYVFIPEPEPGPPFESNVPD